MTVIKNEQVIFCDVDDTLVMWQDPSPSATMVTISDPYSLRMYELPINKGNLKVLKDRKKRGSTIILWSAGGWEWAKAVAVALDLQGHVDYCMSKPIGYIDDKKAEKILGEHIYIPYGSSYG
jgi:hypothetical protein